MCYLCEEDAYNDEKWDCGNSDCTTCFPDSAQPEKENEIVAGPFDGMQFRTSFSGDWVDVKPGQTEFSTDGRKIEFRKKPTVSGMFDNLDGTTAEFFDNEWLLNAVRIRLARGERDFDLKVRFNK